VSAELQPLSKDEEDGTRAIAEKHPGVWPFWLELERLFATLDAARDERDAAIRRAERLEGVETAASILVSSADRLAYEHKEWLMSVLDDLRAALRSQESQKPPETAR
jgi:hypothetical protein